MYRFAIVATVLLLLATAASGQVWLDKFYYNNGTTLGTWAEHLGDWTADNNMAKAEVKFGAQYMTQPKLLFRDCVAQCLVMHNVGANHTLQFGGIALRCVAPGSGTSLIMVKVQNNSSATNPTKFDSIWLYQYGFGSTVSQTSLTPFPSAKVRLTVLDSRVVAQVDSDLDGVWNYTLTGSVTTIPAAAPIGMCGFGGVHIDDYELFDAVLLNDAASPTPTPGSEMKMVMRGWANAPYIAASAFGNGGFVLSKVARFPLSPDVLFGVTAQNLLPTVFKQFQGVLDGSGDGALSIKIPGITALKGLTVFTAFLTYRQSQILNVSNDYQFTIL